MQPTHAILRQLRIRTATHLTRHVLHDVLPQQTLNVLRHVLPSNHETLITIDGTFGSQLRHEELEHVFRGTLHHGADFLEVDPEGFFGADAGQLGGFHVAAFLLDEVGIVRVENVHDAIEEFGVGVGGLTVVRVGVVGGLEVSDLGEESALGFEVGGGGGGFG